MNSASDTPEPDTSQEAPPSSGSARDLIEAARKQAVEVQSVGPKWQKAARVDIPGYEFVREIHRGGQGVVYQAIQRNTKRKVAVKVMRENPLVGSRGRARFEREVEILGQLNHPGIVSIIDSGESGGAFYYVMDYISGRSLDKYIADTEPSIDHTLKLFKDICQIINVAHLKGIIHRDLKPGNIIIDEEGHPHVVDFGLAKIATGEVDETTHLQLMTMTGQFVGSLPWASPEQAQGSPDMIDVRTDVYSLGVVLYQMLTGGRFPYEVVGAMRDILDNILKAEPARPSTVRRQINNEVETIVLKTLSKDRERRYQSAGDLARDIQRYLDGQPIEAKRDSGWYVIRKTLRRYKPQVATAVSLLVLLIVFSVVIFFMYTRATRAEHEAQQQAAAAEAARQLEAEQRQRAESNFEAFQGLAQTFLTGFHDRIADLRGALPARELLLTEAERYLETLQAQATDDLQYQRTLASAHERIGELLAGISAHTLGDTSAGAARYASARRIYERILEARPEDPQALADMARAYLNTGWIYRQSRRFQDAILEDRRAIDTYAAAISALPEVDHRRIEYADARIDAQLALADALHNLALDETDPDKITRAVDEVASLYDGAVNDWTNRAATAPDDPDVMRKLAQAQTRQSNAFILIGRGIKGDADQLARAGDIEAAAPLYDEAIAEFRRALNAADVAALETALAQAPTDADLLRSIMILYHQQGLALMRIALTEAARNQIEAAHLRHEEALALYTQALDIAERLASDDESNLEAQRDLVLMLNKVGNERRSLGELEEARRLFQRSLEIRTEIYASDPVNRHLQDLGLAQYKLAQTFELLADEAPDTNQSLALLQRAQADYHSALQSFTALTEQGAMIDNSRYIRAVNRGLQSAHRKMQAIEGGA